MNELKKYFGKTVKILNPDGKIWEGFIPFYGPPNEFDEGDEENIDMEAKGYPNMLISFKKSDIVSIEIIEDMKHDK